MGNDKDKLNKDKEQEKFIRDLEKEIKTLEFEIEHIKYTNIKNAIIKNVRIFGRMLLKWAPMFVAGIIASTGFTLCLGSPFEPYKVHASAHIERTIDTFGNYDEVKQFTSFKSEKSYLDMCSTWAEKDGHYERVVLRYNLDDKRIAQCIDVANGQLITNFESIFGTPDNVLVEKSNHLTEEEINAPKYSKAVVYTEDPNSFTFRMSTSDEMAGRILFYICAVIAAEVLSCTKSKKFRARCDAKITRYKEDYKPLDSEELNKQLVLKRDNYNLLTE